MKKSERKRPSALVILLAAALLLVALTAVNGILAELNARSRDINIDIDMYQINVDINNADVAAGKAPFASIAEDFKIGQHYDDTFTVVNTGKIDEFVRVIITHYWADEQGNKRFDLDPAYIELDLGSEGWIEEQAARTAERNILYYSRSLAVSEQTTSFLNGIRINPEIKKFAKKYFSEDGLKITIVYEYDGAVFVVDIEADGVQTHNGQDAVRSAWGKAVTISGQNLSLNQ